MGLVGFLLLAWLPGAWISCGLPLPGLPFWARLMLGAVLSPFVTVIQFYALRGLGAPFDLTVLLMVVANLPALYLIYRAREPTPRVDGSPWISRSGLWAGAIIGLVTLASFGPRLMGSQDRVYTGHSMVHADAVYALADGELRPEEPLLAGVRMAYPWAGAVHLAALSRLLDRPLVAVHLWISLLWLVPIAAFALGITRVLGGRGAARLSTVAWLFFGVNVAGSAAMFVLPEQWVWLLDNWPVPVWGDPRYTPWVFKFFFPNAMPFALGLFIALAYLMIHRHAGRGAWAFHLVALLLLAALAVIYPVLVPAALGLVVGRLLGEIVERGLDRRSLQSTRGHGLVLGLGLLFTLAYLGFVTADRVTSAMELTNPRPLLIKGITSLIVCLPLLIGLAYALRRSWHEHRLATSVLVTGALSSLVLHAALSLPFWINEYKFIFTAAVCLAAFPALALQPLLERAGRGAAALLAALVLVLAAPLAAKTYGLPTWGAPPWIHLAQKGPTGRPVADTSGFDLRLVREERAAALLDTVRAKTPTDTILLTNGIGIHLPTLARRHLYLPADEEAHYGVNRTGDYLLRRVRGYDPQVLDQRAAAVAGLYGDDSQGRRDGLRQILGLGRPLALLLEVETGARYGRMAEAERVRRRAANQRLLDWLKAERQGRLIYQGNGYVAWLFDARPAEARS